MSTVPAPQDAEIKKQRLVQAREHFIPKLVALGVDNPYVSCKARYFDRTINDDAIRVYPNENDKGDVYVELITLQFDLIYPERALFVLRHEPDFTQKYRDTGSGSHIIPLTALEPVNFTPELPLEELLRPTTNLAFPESVEQTPRITYEDSGLHEMTMRDQVCIKFLHPASNKAWLNELITEIKSK